MKNQIIITEKMIFGGNTLCKVDGKITFIPFSLPNETLEIQLTKETKDYNEAKIVNIINSSPFRIKPQCEFYEKCGGCNMLHIESEYQKELRKQILTDVFLQNKIELKNLQIVSDKNFNYRARFQFTDGGLCEKKSNKIIPINNCLCAENSINDYLNSIDFPNRPKGRVHIFGSEFCVGKNIIINQNDFSNSLKNKTKITGNKKKKIKIKENHHFSGTTFFEENQMIVKILDKSICFDIRGFFQSNLFVFEKVIKLILENLPFGKNIVDMYCGCGSISTFLSQKYENVILVEHNRDALVYAEKNMTGKNHISFGMSGKNWVQNCAASCGKIDAVVIDPPRSGIEKEVRQFLCESQIPLIIFLSCDPVTQSRDCSLLLKNGYKIQKSYLLDFYPNTSHIESLLILTK